MANFTIQDVSTWSDVELLQQIQSLASIEGLILNGPDNEDSGPFQASLVSEVDGQIIWSDTNITPRLLLLNAFGFLYTRKERKRSLAWVRGTVNIPIARQALPTKDEDPEDLNPDEIASVYSEDEHLRGKI